MAELLIETPAPHVQHLQLNRPDKLNALSLDLLAALPAQVAALGQNPDLRALVLSGAGRAFCAGMDLENFANPKVLAGKFENPDQVYPNFFQAPAWSLRTLGVPCIAAIQGPCLGGGLQIALGADIRLAAPDAVFCVMEIKWGLIPDMSASQTLRELVGIDVAKELTFTGRKIRAGEALRLGLITRIEADPVQAALDLATDIAAKNPEAIRGAKALFHETWAAQDGLEALKAEERIQKSLVFRPNQMEAAQAALEGRPAKFSS